MMKEKSLYLKLYMGRLPGIDRSILKDELVRFQELFFEECGVVIPIFQMIDDEKQGENSFQVEMNGEKYPVIEGLAENEFWVFYPASELSEPVFERTWQARPSVEPNSGAEAAICVGGEEEQKIWTDNGYDIRTRQGYVAFTAAALVRTHQAEFVTHNLIQYFYSRLKEDYPDLVEISQQVIQEDNLIAELKRRLDQGTSIKNMPGILEGFLAATH